MQGHSFYDADFEFTFALSHRLPSSRGNAVLAHRAKGVGHIRNSWLCKWRRLLPRTRPTLLWGHRVMQSWREAATLANIRFCVNKRPLWEGISVRPSFCSGRGVLASNALHFLATWSAIINNRGHNEKHLKKIWFYRFIQFIFILFILKECRCGFSMLLVGRETRNSLIKE